jgi:Flp pilus assembly protein TadD
MGASAFVRLRSFCGRWAVWVFVAAVFAGLASSVDAEDPKANQPKKDPARADAPSKDAPPKDAPTKDAPPKDAPPKDAPPKDAPPKDAPPKDAPPKDAPPKDAPLKVVADPESIEARYKLGMMALAKNDSVAAASDFAKVLEWNASHLGALVNLGWIAQRKQEWVQSESFMRRAVAVAPENPAVWMGLGLAVLEQSRLDAAIAAFAQVVALDPKSARGHRFFGLALGRRGWVQAAEEELRRSLEIEPDDAGAHFNLAVFYLRRKPVAVELARRHYYRALDLGFEPDPSLEESLKEAAAKPSAAADGAGQSEKDPPSRGKSAAPAVKQD